MGEKATTLEGELIFDKMDSAGVRFDMSMPDIEIDKKLERSLLTKKGIMLHRSVVPEGVEISDRVFEKDADGYMVERGPLWKISGSVVMVVKVEKIKYEPLAKNRKK